jgi:hypothetical protein
MTSPTNGGFADNPHRGIASLTFKGRTLRFRTNPNEIWWSYTLNTNVEQTYGGRVVQILSTRIEDLIVKVDCGRGGWEYLNQIVDFLRQMMIDQRESGGTPGTFSYTTRRWNMKVYGLSVPFQDQVTAVNRELELRFKVLEDLNGEISQLTMSKELARLQEGVGFFKSGYNDPNEIGNVGGEHESPKWVSPSDIPSNLGLGQIPNSFTSFLPSIPGLPTP